jgi:hypothetical protein
MTATTQLKHSPGPWTFAAHAGTIHSPPIFPAADDGRLCSRELGRVSGYGAPDGQANGRLMTASPELLTACKAALLALRATSQREKDYSHECQLLRAAILKATGAGQ